MNMGAFTGPKSSGLFKRMTFESHEGHERLPVPDFSCGGSGAPGPRSAKAQIVFKQCSPSDGPGVPQSTVRESLARAECQGKSFSELTLMHESTGTRFVH